MHRFFIAFAASLALASPSLAQALDWQIDPAHSNAQFSVRHMMISNVRGEFGSVTGSANFDGKDATRAKVQAVIDAKSINTREPKRDDHLRSADFFDVAKYPTITFASRKIEQSADGKIKMTGDLTIHGVTKEVVLDVDGPTQAIKDPYGNERVGASATTKVNRKDFGLMWNGLLESGGVVVGDEVAITIDVELKRKASSASTPKSAKPPENG